MKKFLSVLLPLGVICIAIVVFFVMHVPPPTEGPKKPQEKIQRIAVQEAHLETIAPTLQLYAKVENSRIVRLRSALNADVSKVTVLEGHQVRSGQSLVRLDDRDARLELAQQEAAIKEIEAEKQTERQLYKTDKLSLQHEQSQLDLSIRAVDRLKMLSQENYSSEVKLEEALDAKEKNALAVRSRQFSINNYSSRVAKLDARLKRAKAKRDMAALDRERCNITAPFNGKVTSVLVAPGTRVNPGDALVEIFDLDSLELRTLIPLPYLPIMRKALMQRNAIQATANVDGVPIKAVFDRLAADIPDDHGSVDGFFRLSSGKEILEIGRKVDLQLILPSQEQVVALPSDAIYGTDHIYKVVDSRLQRVTITRAGERSTPDGKTQVLVRSPDLVDGERIVVTSLPNAISGLKVIVMD